MAPSSGAMAEKMSFEEFMACGECGEEFEFHVGESGEFEPCPPNEALAEELIS